MNPKELVAVCALPAQERYQHFIRQVADWEEIWSLREATGWVLLGDPMHKECIPVWPHAAYAEAFAKSVFPQAKPEVIPLDAWMERWLPGIRRDQRLLAVFPISAETRHNGVVVTPEQLQADLERELESYE